MLQFTTGQETDGNGVTVRAILFNYEKVFDLIDHRILVEKLSRLNLLTRIINWIIYLIGTNFRGHLVSRKKRSAYFAGLYFGDLGAKLFS